MCKTAITKALECNKNICEVGSILNNDDSFQGSKTVNINTQKSIVKLKEPSDIPDELKFPNYTKQRTAEWFELRKQAPVTASTLHKALILKTLKEQKQFIAIRRGEEEEEEHSEELKKLFEQGTVNEILLC